MTAPADVVAGCTVKARRLADPPTPGAIPNVPPVRRLSQPARITRKKAAILRFIYCRLPTWSRPNRGCVRDHPVFKKLAAVEEYGDQPRRCIGGGAGVAPLTELPQVETGCNAAVHILARGM